MLFGNVAQSLIYNYSRARSLGFTLEYAFLNSLWLAVPGAKRSDLLFNRDTSDVVRQRLFEFLERDSRNITEGLYPISVLAPERPTTHIKRIPLLMMDGALLYLRRAQGRTTQFSKAAQDFLNELPRYYRRNFHYQTDGYLSERSAELYEHQVEMLFGGTADAMRRLILEPLRRQFGPGDGKGLTFLEIGAGTGRATRFVHLAYPKAKIVATDLSDPYLHEARRKLAKFHRIDFVQADGAKLPFQDGHFDAAYSVFLFHELPRDARKGVLSESKRVVKSGGFVGLVDSLQTGDVKVFDDMLSGFPKQFHEPFYRDYIANPMEGIMQELGLRHVSSDFGLFSKVCWSRV